MMATMRTKMPVVLVLGVLVIALALPALPAQAQGGDVLVWVSPTGQDYATWLVEYRNPSGQTLSSYLLPGAPLFFGSQVGGRLVGSDLESIVQFDPRVGLVIHYPVPGLAALTGGGSLSVTAVAQGPDGRYAYNVMTQPEDYTQPAHNWVYVATPGKGDDRAVFESDTESFLAIQPYRWRSDGGALLLHEMPIGIGGYILFWTYQNVFMVDLATRAMTFVGESVDGVTDDFTLVATIERSADYLPTGIAITNFTTGAIMRYGLPPLAETPQVGGDAMFSPDKSKVAFQVARSNPEREKFWTIVVDLVTGATRVVFEEEAVGYEMTFGSLGGWIDNSTLAIGDYWHQEAKTVLVDANTGQVMGQVNGAFLGRAGGLDPAYLSPSATAAVSCAGAPITRLMPSQRGRITITNGTPTNVRENPGTDANRVATVPDGATFTVVQGPTCADGYAWWLLNFDNGVSGWVAEGTLTQYFLEPWQ